MPPAAVCRPSRTRQDTGGGAGGHGDCIGGARRPGLGKAWHWPLALEHLSACASQRKLLSLLLFLPVDPRPARPCGTGPISSPGRVSVRHPKIADERKMGYAKTYAVEPLCFADAFLLFFSLPCVFSLSSSSFCCCVCFRHGMSELGTGKDAGRLPIGGQSL